MIFSLLLVVLSIMIVFDIYKYVKKRYNSELQINFLRTSQISNLLPLVKLVLEVCLLLSSVILDFGYNNDSQTITRGIVEINYNKIMKLNDRSFITARIKKSQLPKRLPDQNKNIITHDTLTATPAKRESTNNVVTKSILVSPRVVVVLLDSVLKLSSIVKQYNTPAQSFYDTSISWTWEITPNEIGTDNLVFRVSYFTRDSLGISSADNDLIMAPFSVNENGFAAWLNSHYERISKSNISPTFIITTFVSLIALIILPIIFFAINRKITKKKDERDANEKQQEIIEKIRLEKEAIERKKKDEGERFRRRILGEDNNDSTVQGL